MVLEWGFVITQAKDRKSAVDACNKALEKIQIEIEEC